MPVRLGCPRTVPAPQLGRCPPEVGPGQPAGERGALCPSCGPSSADSDVGSCPKTQIFLYNLTTCQQTCRSLSEPESHCVQGFAPVDGCGCPDHTFLDEKGRCVPQAKCSCYHRGSYVEAGDVVLRQEERWWVSGAGEGQGGRDSPGGPTSPPARAARSVPPLPTASAGTGGCTAPRSSCSARVSGRCPRAASAPAPAWPPRLPPLPL